MKRSFLKPSIDVKLTVLWLMTHWNLSWAETDVRVELESMTSYGLETNDFFQQDWQLEVEVFKVTENLGQWTLIGQGRVASIQDLQGTQEASGDNYSVYSEPWMTTTFGSDSDWQFKEGFWENQTESWFWRIGKQQVVWGEADGLKVLDVINPQSFREFILDDFDDSRIPLWMINLEKQITDDGLLQLLWIPDTTTHELAPEQSPFELTSPRLVPDINRFLMNRAATNIETLQVNRPKRPKEQLKNSDIGFSWRHSWRQWDYTLNYLYHFIDAPVVRSQRVQEQLILTQEYERSHLLGGTISQVFGNWVTRLELAYETDRYFRTQPLLPGVDESDIISSVIGVDWLQFENHFISFQWFQQTKLSSNKDWIEDQTEHQITFLWEREFNHQTTKLSNLVIHSLNQNDGVVQTQLKHNVSDQFILSAGFDIFYGDAEGVFGQFDESDRFFFNVQYTFD